MPQRERASTVFACAGAMARITAPIARRRRARHARRAARSTSAARWFGRRVVELLDVDLVATGAEHVPPGRAYVYMSNHQSHLDIPMLYATLPSPTIRMLAQEGAVPDPAVGRGPARRRVHRGRSREPRARDAVDRARGGADPRWRQHLPRAGGHALARRPDRQAQEGRLSPRDARPARRSCRSRSAARSTSCRAGHASMQTGQARRRSRSARRSPSRAATDRRA